MLKLILLLVGIGIICQQLQAKKLEIHRCVLDDGSISYQEKKCTKNAPVQPKPTSTPTSISRQNNTNKKIQTQPILPQPKAVKYQKLADIAVDDASLQHISAQVRTYQISLIAPRQWSLFKKVYNNKLLHIKFLDEQSGSQISLIIDFIYADGKQFSEQELTQLVYLVGSQYVTDSQQGAVIAEKMQLGHGRGIMATFAHLNTENSYKYTSKGAIFMADWLIQFTLLSIDDSSFSHRYVLQNLFESLQISR